MRHLTKRESVRRALGCADRSAASYPEEGTRERNSRRPVDRSDGVVQVLVAVVFIGLCLWGVWSLWR